MDISIFRQKLIEVRDEILDEMYENHDSCELEELNREDFLPYDINCGNCYEFASRVCEFFPEECDSGNMYEIWIEDMDEDCEILFNTSHCVIFYNGKYYDSECLDGVESIYDIPVVKNRNKTREQVTGNSKLKWIIA